jgi:hypothetical protein
MQRLLILSIGVVFAAGCASTPPDATTGSDHPASANAAASPMPALSGTLAQSEPLGTPRGEASAGSNHGGMTGMTGMSHGEAAATSQPTAAAGYACPMHPEVTSNEPGKCPKCGMKLVKNEIGGHGAH